MNKSLALLLLSCFFLPRLHADETFDATSLDDLHGAVTKLVKRHYPESTSHVLERTIGFEFSTRVYVCLLYTSPSPRDGATSRMPSSA